MIILDLQISEEEEVQISLDRFGISGTDIPEEVLASHKFIVDTAGGSIPSQENPEDVIARNLLLEFRGKVIATVDTQPELDAGAVY